jgi:uncharacterized membrane protein required for colicin V production
MIDAVLGALVVVLAVKGWMRGLVREVIGFVVLVAGTILAFRLSTPFGRVLAAMSGSSPGAARLAAGIIIFLAISIAAAVVIRIAHLGMRALPGLPTLNRVGGAAFAVLAFALLITLVISLASVTPLPEAVAAELEQSKVAETLTAPEGVPQRVLGFLSGDRVVEVSLRIQELTGGLKAVAKQGEPLLLPSLGSAVATRLPGAEGVMFDLLNRARVDADVDPVLRSDGLDQVAFELALGAFEKGTLETLDDPALRSLLEENSLPSVARAEVAALAASPEAAHEGLVAEDSAAISGERYARVGIAVVQGPIGLVVVEVLAG